MAKLTQEQITALKAFHASVITAKATLNGNAVERVLDAFNDAPPSELTRLASSASMALSSLVAYLEATPTIRGDR